MSVFLQPIYTQTVSVSGGQFGITFNNIPQTFTDLVLKISARNVSAVNSIDMYLAAINNESGSNTNLSQTNLYGNGSSAVSGRGANQTVCIIGQVPGTSSTASTFGSSEVYLPNYTNSNFKSWTIDTVTENNGTTANIWFGAGLWRQTAAINAFTIYLNGGSNISQYSTVSLYGILRQGI